MKFWTISLYFSLVTLFTSAYVNFYTKVRTNAVEFLGGVRLAMVSKEDAVNALQDSKRDLDVLSSRVESFLSPKIIDLDQLKATVVELERKSASPTFWDNQDEAQNTFTELSIAKTRIERVQKWKRVIADVHDLIEMAQIEPEEEVIYLEEANLYLAELGKDLADFKVERLLGGKYDKCSAIINIQSGAGGTEAQDWAGMLLRMYRRYAERKGFKVTTLEENKEDFGIKSAELQVDGAFAYGYLAGEKGTHRLVRISPFNAQGKRQTSFAAVETYPVLPTVSQSTF